jgi:hypothetical protein
MGQKIGSITCNTRHSKLNNEETIDTSPLENTRQQRARVGSYFSSVKYFLFFNCGQGEFHCEAAFVPACVGRTEAAAVGHKNRDIQQTNGQSHERRRGDSTE